MGAYQIVYSHLNLTISLWKIGVVTTHCAPCRIRTCDPLLTAARAKNLLKRTYSPPYASALTRLSYTGQSVPDWTYIPAYHDSESLHYASCYIALLCYGKLGYIVICCTPRRTSPTYVSRGTSQEFISCFYVAYGSPLKSI